MSDVNAHTEVKMGSNRSFGLVFAAVFAIIAFWPVVNSGPVRIWALAIAVVFLALSFFAPHVLRPLNRLWFLFGLLLSKIVSPIVMGIIFFTTITPIGLIRRIRNPDPLNQAFEPETESYWIERDSMVAVPSSMRKQF